MSYILLRVQFGGKRCNKEFMSKCNTRRMLGTGLSCNLELKKMYLKYQTALHNTDPSVNLEL